MICHWETKTTVLEMNLWALWIKRHQCPWLYEEIYSKSHPGHWLCTSSRVQSLLFCFVSPSKHCHEALPPFILFFSLLPSFLLSPLSSLFRFPRRFPPPWLWKPAVANYGETKGRTWMGFPAARPANQAGRETGRQPQCSCGKQRLISSLAFLLWTKNTGRYITQEDNAANVNSDPGSPLFSCISFSHSLSSSPLPRLSSLPSHHAR